MTGSCSYLKIQVYSKLNTHCHYLTYQSQSITYTVLCDGIIKIEVEIGVFLTELNQL